MNISPTFETPYRGPHTTHGPPVGYPCCKKWLTTIRFPFWPGLQSENKHRQFLDSFTYVVSDVIQQKAGLRCPSLYGQTCDYLFLSFYSKHINPEMTKIKKKACAGMCRERQVLRFKLNISSSRLHHQNAAVVMKTAQVSDT